MSYVKFDALWGKSLQMGCWMPYSYWEPLHYHVHYELGLALSGTGIFRIEDQEYPVGPGDIFVQSPYRGHIAKNDPEDGCNYLFINIKPEFLLGNDEVDHLIMDTFDSALPSKISAKEPESRAIASLLEDSYRLYQTTEITRNLVIKARLIEAVARIHEYFERAGQLVAGHANRRRYYLQMLSVIDYIRNNLKTDLTSDRIAGQVNLSSSRFEHLFSQIMGTSLARCLRKIRMEKARELLRHSDLSIKQIAYEVGLTPVRLTRQFKHVYGSTPQEYLRERRGS